MKLNTKCVICDSTENLSTNMNITVENATHAITLCEEHSENSTAKQIREAIIGKIHEIDELKSKLEEYGYKVIEDIPIPPKLPKQNQEITTEPTPAKTPVKAPVKAEVVKNLNYRIPQITGAGASVHAQINPDSIIEGVIRKAGAKGEKVIAPKTVKSELQVVEGRMKIPMAVPKRMVDADGSTTTISIVKSDVNNKIQEMAKNGNISYAPDSQPRECTMCGGTGVSKVNKKPCPKCKGQ